MKKLIKNFIGEFLLILGVGLFVFNVFNFQSQGYPETFGGRTRMPSMPTFEDHVFNYQCIQYYYTNDSIKLITFGAVLITIGLLVIRNKKKIEI